MGKRSVNIIVTGSTGFVGKNLLNRIKISKLSISTIDRKKYTTNIKNIKSLEYSEYWNSIVNVKYYIHLAGKAHDLKGVSNESEYFEVNYDLTKRLYDRFLDDQVAQSFIFISSVKAVADHVEGELTENSIPNPVTTYGQSKLKAEQYILNNVPRDKNVVILRPCMIHGPGNKGNLNLLYNIVSKGIPWPLGAYNNFRTFLTIDNLCYVITEILDGNVPSGVYNVADDDPLSTKEIVSIISKASNKKARIWNVSKHFIQIISKVGNVLPIPLNEERLKKLTANYLVSNEKIKKAIGVERMPVSAVDGMTKTIKGFGSF